MNILITGANGQLGMEFRKLAKHREDRYIFSDINMAPGLETLSLDITNYRAVELVCESENIGTIINCAAYTAVDKAESDISMADLINNKAASYLADIMKKRDGLLIHFSTDYVFNGESFKPYKENEPASPCGVYGVTKLAGERAIIDSGCKYMIFRTSWLYSAYGHNFVKTILKRISKRETLDVVFDQIGSPTNAADLAEAVYSIIKENKFKEGLYHYSNEGVASWYDLAVAINEITEGTCKINPCLSSEYKTAAKRPIYSVLDKSLIKSTFGLNIPHWRSSLEKCVKSILR